MQTIYQKMETTELDAAIEALKAEVAEVKAKGLALDMARGKPSPSQVDISRPMLDILNADADLHDGNVDCSNYGCFEGIPSARKLAGEFLGCPAEQTLVLGSSSLLIEHDIAGMFWRCGSCGSEPWEAYEAAHDGKKVKFLCPVPGYDRHFGITADLGIENVPVAMIDNGPDMDEVERLVAADDSIKASGVCPSIPTLRALPLARTPCVAWSRCPRPRPISASSGTTPIACTTYTTRPTNSPISSTSLARRAPRIAWWPLPRRPRSPSRAPASALSVRAPRLSPSSPSA